jgi:acyl-CoA thioester hydrolase
VSVENFRHRISITPRFGDADMMGHINNAKYITYIEEARIGYAREVLAWDGQPHSLAMILARTEMDYLLPLSVGQSIDVWTRCARLGGKSFDLEYLILDSHHQREVAKAKTVMVAFNYQTQSTMPIPESWRQRMLDYEILKPL